jgi:hypothetical protein
MLTFVVVKSCLNANVKKNISLNYIANARGLRV